MTASANELGWLTKAQMAAGTDSLARIEVPMRSAISWAPGCDNATATAVACTHAPAWAPGWGWVTPALRRAISTAASTFPAA